MHEVSEYSVGPPQPSEILHDFGFFGRYLHIHSGGRGGKQFVLVALDKHDGHLTQRELLDRCKISAASLSEVVSKLESESLITRSACEQDRRQLNIELTDIGKARARHMREERERFERAAFSCLDDQELRQLATLLERVKNHWNTLEESEVCA